MRTRPDKETTPAPVTRSVPEHIVESTRRWLEEEAARGRGALPPLEVRP